MGITAATPLLDVIEVDSGYAEVQILHGVSLHVCQDEVVTIVGPNGAGKSTLVKLLVGLLHPWSGTITFAGSSAAGLKPDQLARAGLGYVPQLGNVFRRMSVEENLLLAGHRDKRSRKDRVDEMFHLFPDLARLRGSKAGELSGGQRQMLAISRALMPSPRLLMLDEPSAGLSPALAERVFQEVKRLSGGGLAILMVEQNVERALQISDRAYVLVAGANRFEGRGSEVLDNEEIGRLYLGG
jgi:ABC-type branched-subunit amino acid transport system ATPase component